MGCYGIGVTRIVGAAIEQNSTMLGIIWPRAHGAVRRSLVCPSARAEARRFAPRPTRLHDELADAGVDVLLDDRGLRPGVMFADLELIGIPHRITIGERGLRRQVEYQSRRDGVVTAVPLADAGVTAIARLADL